VEGVAIEAGRIMLNRVNELLMTKQDFAFETTLSTLSYVSLIKKAKVAGYNVSLIYFWLSSPEMAKERVAFRVLNGGHYIPDDIVERRYKKGIRNLFKLFMPLVDSFMICDNSSDNTLIIARKENSAIIIENSELWDKLNRQYYEFSA
jgi:predicted ABC-type ATPase